MSEVVAENKMSISRALKEIKILTKRIEDGIKEIRSAGTFAPGNESPAKQMIDNNAAVLQSVQALMKRRDVIKRAIINSNAITRITVNGQSYSVAEAIERKAAIVMEKALEKQLRESYYSNLKIYEQAKVKIQAEAEAKAERIVKEAGMKKPVEGDEETAGAKMYREICDEHLSKNQVGWCEIEGIVKIFTTMRDDIETFDADIDSLLAESNATTFIIIP